MSEETQSRILRMAKNRDVDGIGGEVMERINTNAFAGEFAGKMCFLLYPDTALMNHDCRPKYATLASDTSGIKENQRLEMKDAKLISV